jgi:hypothetical protein
MSAEAKALGDAAFAAKSWTEALSQYSQALEACDGSDKDLLKKIYGNRSAVYSASKNFTAALSDGEKCVDLDGEWSKSHIRVGDALFGLRKFTEASNAYNRADRLEPGKGYDQKANLAINNRQQQEAYQQRQQQQRSSGNGGKQSPPIIPTEGLMNTIYTTCEKAMFFLFILYLLPLSWIPLIGSMFPHYSYMYKLLLLCSLIISGLHVYCTVGRPQFNAQYLQSIMSIQGVHAFFLSIVLLPSRPYMLAAAAILFNHVVIRANALVASVRPYMSNVLASLPPQFATYKPQLEQINTMLSTPGGIQQFKTAFMNVSCTAEVMQGVLLVVELLLPTRNFMFLFLWWQYLMMRYIVDTTTGTGCVKTAFITLDKQISSLTTHSMCPSIIGKGYGYVKNYMIQQVESAQNAGQANAAGGGGFVDSIKSKLSSCSIS